MPEPDQTRWIGIRPTNPPETIPVSMAAAPPCAKVEPCAANNAFNTITKKLTPAVSDLQAIEKYISYYFYGASGAAGQITKNSPAVPAGKLWVITHAVMWNDSGALTLALMWIKDGTDNIRIQLGKAPAERITTTYFGKMIMKPLDFWCFDFYGVPANDHNLVCTLRGYQVSQYT